MNELCKCDIFTVKGEMGTSLLSCDMDGNVSYEILKWPTLCPNSHRKTIWWHLPSSRVKVLFILFFLLHFLFLLYILVLFMLPIIIIIIISSTILFLLLFFVFLLLLVLFFLLIFLEVRAVEKVKTFKGCLDFLIETRRSRKRSLQRETCMCLNVTIIN